MAQETQPQSLQAVANPTATAPQAAPVLVSPEVKSVEARPHASPARIRKRHWGVVLSFLLLVVAPIATSVWYLYSVAADQYASTVGFSVRSEDAASPTDLLVGISSLSSAGSKDTDVIYEFLQSQQLVTHINDRIDLKSVYSKPEYDPVFAFDSDGSIEDLLSYWERMVKVYYDAGTGLIEIRANAFTAEDAQLIAEEIFVASSNLVNDLSAVSRADSTRYAQEALEQAQDQLRSARQDLTRFRNETQIVDPLADVQVQMGLLTTLQAQLAESLIELDLLSDITRQSDSRIEQVERKIEVIRNRIDEERRKLGFDDSENNDAFSNLVGQFEVLAVDLEFAEQSYLLARASYDSALADARRQSRYLAAYVEPTLAETPLYPDRGLLVSIIVMFSFMTWSILVLIGYSIKDRR